MRKLYGVLGLLVLLSLMGTAVLVILMPERVPMHYNLAGEADRLGSRYENLLWPLVMGLMAGFWGWLARRERRKGEESNERILLVTGVCTLAFLTGLSFFSMTRALRYDPAAGPAFSMEDLNRFVGIGLGALLMVLGNIMPKARRNSLFGIRTRWSLASDTVWQKSQRFGGIATVAGGFLLILLALVLPGLWNVAALAAVLTVLCILCVEASRRYALAERRRERKDG